MSGKHVYLTQASEASDAGVRSVRSGPALTKRLTQASEASESSVQEPDAALKALKMLKNHAHARLWSLKAWKISLGYRPPKTLNFDELLANSIANSGSYDKQEVYIIGDTQLQLAW